MRFNPMQDVRTAPARDPADRIKSAPPNRLGLTNVCGLFLFVILVISLLILLCFSLPSHIFLFAY